MYLLTHTFQKHIPWNKGKLVGQKPPLKLKEVWAIRIRLQIANRIRDLALFNLAIDSKLRSCDLVKLRVRDISHGSSIAKRAMVMQQKTQLPVQFEIMEQTRDAIARLIAHAKWLMMTACLRVGSVPPPIFLHGNIPGLCVHGYL